MTGPSQGERPSRRTARRRAVGPGLLCETLEARCLLDGVPFAIGGDPRVHPEDFRATVFASGLDYPYSMVRLADGSLLVATSPSATGNFYNSTGELRRLVDADGNGVADDAGTVLYSGLPGTLTAVRQAGDLFFVTSTQSGSERISVLRAGATPADPLSLIDSIRFSFPVDDMNVPWDHLSYTLAVRDTPGQPGDHDLFFNVGAEYNLDPTTHTVPVSGLLNATLNGDSIYMVTVHDTGNVPIFSGLTQVATGLRNAAGIAVQPSSGDLYFEDNGIDNPPDEQEPLSVDTLNRIAAADIGTQTFNYGFPNQYVEYRTGRTIGSGGLAPLAAFQPFPDPFNGSESEGPAEIGFAPANFPAGLNNGVFIGFFGRGLPGRLNEENPVVYYDLTTGTYFHFIECGQANVSYLTTMVASGDSLFLADLGEGVIYQIKALNPSPRAPAPAASHTPVPAVPGGALLANAASLSGPPVVLVYGGPEATGLQLSGQQRVLLAEGDAGVHSALAPWVSRGLPRAMPTWMLDQVMADELAGTLLDKFTLYFVDGSL
jgi:glucose/arabinose dehydrogenase